MVVVPIMQPASAPTASQSVSLLSCTELASKTLQSMTLDASSASGPVRRTSVKLSMPLDVPGDTSSSQGQTNNAYGSKRPLRRDSLERRNALLKGKEGSRQRRRWENDRLLSNPWVEPPLPSDWEVRPTYPTRTVPYYLAPLWDAAEFQRSVEAKLSLKKHGRKNSRAGKQNATSPAEEAASAIPREIRTKLKHARAAKGLLKDLEEIVRKFVVRWNEKEARLREDGLDDVLISDTEDDGSDDEVVFVGRGGVMHDSPGRKQQEEDDGGLLQKEKLVFEGLVDDKGAAFGRWLVHEIAAYYQLRSYSVTVDGEPRKREAYVGIEVGSRLRGGKAMKTGLGNITTLPRPLYAMV